MFGVEKVEHKAPTWEPCQEPSAAAPGGSCLPLPGVSLQLKTPLRGVFSRAADLEYVISQIKVVELPLSALNVPRSSRLGFTEGSGPCVLPEVLLCRG